MYVVVEQTDKKGYEEQLVVVSDWFLQEK